MGDADGPLVTRKIYEKLIEKEILYLHAIPYALDAAVQELRTELKVPPHRWASFIHMGI